mgnify:CR=1 FL=1
MHKNDKKINIGIIGLGVGKHILENSINNKNIKYIYLFDFNKGLLKYLIKEYKSDKIICYSKYSNSNNKLSLSILYIASYDNFHYRQIVSALNSNINVYVEKPICQTNSQLNKISELLTKKNKIKFSSNMVLRTEPLFKKIKNNLSKNFYGKIKLIEAEYHWGRQFKLNEWRSNMKFYSINQGAAIHMIDLVIWLIGKYPNYVYGMGNKSDNFKLKQNSLTIFFLEFSDNFIVKILANGSTKAFHHHTLKIFGIKKTFIHEFNSSYEINSNNSISHVDNMNYPDKKHRINLWSNFLKDCIGLKSKNLITKKHILKLTRICFCADESIKKNKRIKINYD